MEDEIECWEFCMFQIDNICTCKPDGITPYSEKCVKQISIWDL